MNYYLAIGGEQHGPFPRAELLAQGMRRDTMVWTEGMGQWQRADCVADLATLFASPASAPPPPPMTPNFSAAPSAAATLFDLHGVESTKLAAGLCGILIGGLGIHKFILGYTKAGIIMLLVTVLTLGFGGAVMHVIGIIEGIIYLTKSDQEFYQTYMVNKKPWF
jgi:TM2 domain-containing membrane protein YozV